MNIELLEEAYGFKIKEREKIKNIYRTETNQGTKCIKRAHMSPHYFSFMYSAVKHLYENGFEGVIPYNTTLDGRICIEEDKYIYYVVDWVESRECKFKRQEELKMAIKAAAELHNASVGYKPPEDAKPRIYYNRWIEKFERKCGELLEFAHAIEQKEYKDDFDVIFDRHLDYFLNQGRYSIELLQESQYEKISALSEARGEFCHHDMANHNFLITPDNRTLLIDFDYCIMDTRLHDVSSLVIRNMRHGVWELDKAYFILNEYCKYYTLSDKELQVMKAFMTFPQDFWQVGLQYYEEKQPWAMEYFITRLNRAADDLELREKFLKELFER